jgi:integrase
MKTTITKTLLLRLPPLPLGKQKARIFDDKVQGFIAERRASVVTFYMRYSDPRRRAREIKLGRLGDVTVEQARRQAEQIKAAVSLGGDPLGERERARAVPTLAEFAADRYLPYCRDRLHPLTVVNYDCYLRRRVLPALGRKALDEVTLQDVAALRRNLAADGISAGTVNRHLAMLRSMFNLAIRWQVMSGRNPAASPGMLREPRRDVYLDGAQTQALLKALGMDPCQDAAAALALLAVTGARKNEVLRARWEFVDMERGVLTVPRAKGGRTRHVPLSDYALAILRMQAGRKVADNPHVFPSRTRKGKGKPLEDVRRVWDRVKQLAGLPACLRIHDLRHSFASALANRGIPLNEIGVVLGHTQLSTTARYAHHAPQRMVETATQAIRAWDLSPVPPPSVATE